MPSKNHDRKPRADAERNRLHLLKVARKVFDKKGSSASLEEIARAADVGIGTLYRHFPTRAALVDALFSREREQLVQAAAALSKVPPPEAVREWLLLFVDYLANKQIIAEILNSLAGRSERVRSRSPEILVDTLAGLLDRGKKSGGAAAKVEAMDLLGAIVGVATFGTEDEWAPSAKRLVEVISLGLRSKP